MYARDIHIHIFMYTYIRTSQEREARAEEQGVAQTRTLTHLPTQPHLQSHTLTTTSILPLTLRNILLFSGSIGVVVVAPIAIF